jgi:hypothetical protein
MLVAKNALPRRQALHLTKCGNGPGFTRLYSGSKQKHTGIQQRGKRSRSRINGQADERKHRGFVGYFWYWDARRRERASASPGTPRKAATRGRILPCLEAT